MLECACGVSKKHHAKARENEIVRLFGCEARRVAAYELYLVRARLRPFEHRLRKIYSLYKPTGGSQRDTGVATTAAYVEDPFAILYIGGSQSGLG